MTGARGGNSGNRTSPYYWGEEELDILREAYQDPKNGLQKAIVALAPFNRSQGTIAAKACRLALTAPRPRKNSRD